MTKPFQPDNFIASTVRDIPRSGIRDFFDIVQGMKDVISLGEFVARKTVGAGEPSIELRAQNDTPPIVP